MGQQRNAGLSRREFVRAGALAAGAAVTPGMVDPLIARVAHPWGSDTVRVGLIGCGGRGTGAAVNALEAGPEFHIVALADVFDERIGGCRKQLEERESQFGPRVRVDDSRCYVGTDAFKRLIASGVDSVILATPPHFRPAHFAEAVRAGKHVFMEKPVAVDGPGVRTVLEAARLAEEKGLSVVAGTQRRHQTRYRETIERLSGGAVGELVSGRAYWNQGGLWAHEQRPEWSDMEWMLRNWLYFTWLSGDHIVEQHVHNLDVFNWVVGEHPVRCMGMGGRQVRVEKKYGHIFDHFAIEYEYPSGFHLQSMCRQIDGCASRVEEVVQGTDGSASVGYWIRGREQWSFKGEEANPYVQEHAHLLSSILGRGRRLNEGRQVAEATLTAIMGRMSAYTGQAVTWEQALGSKEDLTPKSYEFGPMPTPPVAVPGRTPLL